MNPHDEVTKEKVLLNGVPVDTIDLLEPRSEKHTRLKRLLAVGAVVLAGYFTISTPARALGLDVFQARIQSRPTAANLLSYSTLQLPALCRLARSSSSRSCTAGSRPKFPPCRQALRRTTDRFLKQTSLLLRTE